MKKKNLISFLTLAFAAGLVLASCDGTTTSGDSSDDEDPTSVVDSTGGDGDSTSTVNVTSVTIRDEYGYSPETEVFDDSSFQLNATVVSDSSEESDNTVTWSVDDETIATVNDGYVTVANLGRNGSGTFTVTATSTADNTVSDSITFNAVHSPVDQVNSKPADIEYSDYLYDGVISTVGYSDTGLIFSDVYDTKFYVEVEFRITDLNPSDSYPKVGLMTGTDSTADWNSKTDPTNFYFVDSQLALTTYVQMGFVTTWYDETESGWNWNNTGYTSITSNPTGPNTWTRIGLLRDGTTYFLYYGVTTDNFASYGLLNTYTHTNIAADTPSYAWFGGFAAQTSTRNYKAYVGDEVNDLFDEPTSLSFTNSSYLLTPGESYATSLTSDADYLDFSKVTYASSDESAAIVDENGVVTVPESYDAGDTDVTITATYTKNDSSTISATMTITASSAQANIVNIDGVMDEAGYTDAVKENTLTLTSTVTNYVTFYAFKNANGVVIFADYYVDTLYPTTNTNWWENENVEFRLGTSYYLASSDDDQLYVSSLNGGSSNIPAVGGSYAVVGPTQVGSLYNYKFEVFVPYSAIVDGIDSSTDVYFQAGSAPDSGWVACSWWYGSDPSSFLVITTDGLVSAANL